MADLDEAADRLAAEPDAERAGEETPERAPVDLIANYSAFQQVRRHVTEASPLAGRR